MEARPSDPFFSVIVPVRQGGAPFARCLEALSRSRFADRELVVVDDGSTDGSVDLARRAGARIVSTQGPRGPAAARNLGARLARAPWLFFLDADCAVHPDTLERAAAVLRADPGLDALFGSYDADSPAPGTVSRYRNLLHHWVHQHGREEASTFWAGCGAIRRTTFDEAGGFDVERYPRPSIEDIDLGVRLRARGRRIRLAREVQVTHWKAWTLGSMIRTDVLARAAPWTELALRSGGFPRDLNVKLRNRASLVAAVGATASLMAAPWAPPLLLATGLFGAAMVALELDFFGFLCRRGGARFALACVPLHAIHLLCAATGLTVGVLRHIGSRR